MPPQLITPLIIFGVFVAIAIAAAVFSHLREKKRTEAFQRLAEELHFDFFLAGRTGLLEELGGFHLFNIGHTKQIKNLLQGAAGGLEVRIFDYRYVTGHGKNRHTWQQSVFVARRAGLGLAQFSLRPETIWHKLGNLFGLRDIDFPSHPTFSSRYLLKGPREAAVRELFAPPVLDWFEAHPGLNVEGSGDLLLYSKYKRLDPEKIRDFMAEGFEILKLFDDAEADAG